MRTRSALPCLSRGLRARGVVMVEAAFTVAVVLLVTLGAIVLTTMVNAKATLDVGVGRGLRMGATRGNIERSLSNVIPDIDVWQRTGTDAPPSTLKPFLFSADSTLDHYDSWAEDRFKRKFRELPREWIYTMVYVNESLRQSLGGSLRYPCDATERSNLSCLDCRFIDPLLRPPDGVSSSSDLRLNPLRMECSYTPLAASFAPVLSLVEFLSGNSVPNPFVVRTSQAISAYN